MARFHFSLRSATPAPAGAAPPRVARGWTLDAAIDTPAVGQGPGWFESSWELVRGLEVREGLPGDARLNEWLEAHARERGAGRNYLVQHSAGSGKSNTIAWLAHLEGVVDAYTPRIALAAVVAPVASAVGWVVVALRAVRGDNKSAAIRKR